MSPRVKDALSRAFVTSNELGHSYVGPEHFRSVWPKAKAGRQPAAPLRPDAAGAAPTGQQGGRQGRRGWPRRDADQHAGTRQVLT